MTLLQAVLACWFSALQAGSTSGDGVRLELAAMPLSRAIPELSRALGRSLAVSSELAGEVVVLRVQGAEPAEVLRRLAEATEATWVEQNGLLRLALTDAQRKQQRDAELAYRERAVGEAIRKMAEPLARHPNFDQQAMEEASQRSQGAAVRQGGFSPLAMVQAGRNVIAGNPATPTGRAVARLARLIGARALAQLGDGERIVFSTQPNPMQRRFPNGGFDAIRLLVAEQSRYADAEGARQDGGIEQLLGAVFGGGTRSAVSGTPAKALLSVQRQKLLDGYEFRIALFDGDGRQVFTDGMTMLLETSGLNLLDALGQPPSDGEEIELSPVSRELLQSLRGLTGLAFGQAPSLGMSPEVAGRLRRPDLYEPLEYFHGEVFRGIGKAYGKNVVAAIPDGALASSSFLLPGQKLTVSAFLKGLQDLKTMTVQTEGDWIVGKPTRPWYQRQQRQDRAALARLIASAGARGTLRLDDLASYALTNPPLLESPVASLLALLTIPGAASNPNSMQWELLRFYGSLTAGQRQRLAAGDAIPLRELTPSQRGNVWRMVYLPGFLGLGGLSVAGGLPAPLARTEPTEILPNGLPPGSSLQVGIQRSEVVVDAGESRPGLRLFSALGAEELGAMMQLREDPTMGAMVGPLLPDWKQFRLGEKVRYSFLFRFTPEVVLGGSLEDVVLDERAPAASFEQLPQAFRDRVQRAREQMRQGAAQLGSLFGGGQAPPRP
ncbi:MAG: hypothetical protein N2109_00290 [Fimbriimonadales bacterium]|nr:hypothetical protein [Fimbriimonadales bacterium]